MQKLKSNQGRGVLMKKPVTLALIISLSSFMPLFAADKKVVIKGSTTVLPITLKIIESYRKTRPDVAVSVDGSGSGNGIKALIDGSCDLADSSREMKKEEVAKAAAKGRIIREIPIAYDMLVPVVHPSNTVKNLTRDQLRAIYNGQIKNWKDVGGADMRIVVISRDTSSGTYESWNDLAIHRDRVRADALLQASSGAVVTTVAGNRRAIGYVGYGYVDRNIKALEVDSVPATILNGRSGRFPISRKLYMYADEKNITKETSELIKFVLSPSGQRLVKEAGFIPLK